MRTDRLAREFPVEFRWYVFPLHPETPEEGMELTDLLKIPAEQLAPMQARVREVAAAEGLPLAERSRTYNSRRAQELGKWAETRGVGDAWRQAVYRAFFVEGRNIALVEELARLAVEVGLDGEAVKAVLAQERFAAAVDADWQRAEEAGISAVPSHICEGTRLVGFAKYQDFLRLIGRG
ncbi:2-hydroxychromene-2-carboxylate isomerase [Geomonas silvestris]|uniref:2-hydroxychromene-2-carboxylate isomerase n=1 Tax=Geomonas silvestris TaxID=2740184 RepID=A0A6V8MHN4_9BACT|nr:2-hydroxychromene-2-carboxylate isomerase [Geomonas silvestris]